MVDCCLAKLHDEAAQVANPSLFPVDDPHRLIKAAVFPNSLRVMLPDLNLWSFWLPHLADACGDWGRLIASKSFGLHVFSRRKIEISRLAAASSRSSALANSQIGGLRAHEF